MMQTLVVEQLSQGMPPVEVECDGVDYSPKYYAGKCPRCGELVKAHTTKPFEGRWRTRYHRCECGKSFKSLEQDPTI
jgi:hypothetical protein